MCVCEGVRALAFLSVFSSSEGPSGRAEQSIAGERRLREGCRDEGEDEDPNAAKNEGRSMISSSGCYPLKFKLVSTYQKTHKQPGQQDQLFLIRIYCRALVSEFYRDLPQCIYNVLPTGTNLQDGLSFLM